MGGNEATTILSMHFKAHMLQRRNVARESYQELRRRKRHISGPAKSLIACRYETAPRRNVLSAASVTAEKWRRFLTLRIVKLGIVVRQSSSTPARDVKREIGTGAAHHRRPKSSSTRRRADFAKRASKCTSGRIQIIYRLVVI